MKSHTATHEKSGTGKRLADYLPLLAVLVLTLLSATAKEVAFGAWNGMRWMHNFMGFFLVVFSMFKFFDLSGFADGFQKYDLLGKQFRLYALAYPFIELGLGLGYLAQWQPIAVYSATIVVLLWGALGVIHSLRKGMNLKCACMGNVLQVPLSVVALLEDVGMAAMAAVMLIIALSR